jgi:hypothetical protein
LFVTSGFNSDETDNIQSVSYTKLSGDSNAQVAAALAAALNALSVDGSNWIINSNLSVTAI